MKKGVMNIIIKHKNPRLKTEKNNSPDPTTPEPGRGPGGAAWSHTIFSKRK